MEETSDLMIELPTIETTTYKTAGVIPFSGDGFWLALMKEGHADFGGKRNRDETEAWETARREMAEEGGLRLKQYEQMTFHPESKSKAVFFYAHTDVAPIPAEDAIIKAIRFVPWREYLDSGLPCDLHPRLKYDKGGLVRKMLRSLAKTHTKKPKRQQSDDPQTRKESSSGVRVDTKYKVGEEEKVLTLREDINMRAAYWLQSLTYDEYIALHPKRKSKCDAEGRDVEAEFARLQSYLKEVMGREQVMRPYTHAQGKTVGRLFSVGLQNLWSEVRGALCTHLTDADMSNCHPRILLWICDSNSIPADGLRAFIKDREAVYKAIMESKGEHSDDARNDAKATVLAMMNDEQPLRETNRYPETVKVLDIEFKRLQKQVSGLDQYAQLEKLARDHKVTTRSDGSTVTKHNKLGSWLNLILCMHENEMVNTASKYMWERHRIETGLLSFDGFMMYGNHYAREEELCSEMQMLLKREYSIDMPWTFKPHSTAISMPDDFQVYDIPQSPYLANINDKYLQDEADFARIVSAVRAEYEMSEDTKRGAYRAAAESLLVRSKRPLSAFAYYWDAPMLGLDGQVLKYYSRESDEEQHIFNVKTELGLLGKSKFSEAQLRDYFVSTWGDNMLTVEGDKSVYVWWRQRWHEDDGSIVGHVLLEMVRKLFASSIAWYKEQLRQATQEELQNDTMSMMSDMESEAGSEQDSKVKQLAKAIKELANGVLSYGNTRNTNVRKLVVEQLRSFAMQTDPFDQQHHLFCFTNAVYDVQRMRFVKASKYDFCLMTCGKPWIPPKAEETAKVAALFESILPDEEMRRGYTSVLKSGFTGTRPENFTIANGGGRNGKGVLNENATNCAGHYAAEGHLALLTKPIKDGPNPEAAGLHRKRLVIFSEPEDGLSESLRLSCIKKLTGCAELNARACHSNKTLTELCGTIIMECNKQPAITGEKGEAALDRVRIFPFDMTFTADEEKLKMQPNKYKPVDKSLKTPEFKEKHRCAFFQYIMQHGCDEAWFPDKTKALGAKYLEENDDLSLWFLDNYKLEMKEPPIFVSVKEMWHRYTMSNAYEMMSKAEKRRVTQTTFEEEVKKNPMLKKYYVDRMKAKVKYPNGIVKYNNRVGVLHHKRKEEDGDDCDDW